jgi:hypothetical protein
LNGTAVYSMDVARELSEMVVHFREEEKWTDELVPGTADADNGNTTSAPNSTIPSCRAIHFELYDRL